MAKVLHGNASGNQLNAGGNRTQVYGLQGNDTLSSDNKSDVLLVGGSGDDSLIMLGGDGTLAGGKGSDTFELNYSATKKLSATIEDLVPSEDKIVVNFDGNTAPQISSSTTTDGNVILRDNSGNLNVTLNSVRENDYLDSDVSDNVWEVLRLTNDVREFQGRSLLTASEGLTAGAQIRAQEITALGMSGVLTNHTRPDGTPYYTVLDGKYNFPGENLDGGALSPKQVVQEWIGSASHYANIVNPDFKKLGVGYNEYDADPSDNRFYWTQMFADSLNNPETVDVSTASPEVHTVSKTATLTEDPDTYAGNDYGVTIAALGGGDRITTKGAFVSISGGTDNDTLQTDGEYSTINAGAGNDSIALNAANNLIQYAAGDGSDTVSGFNSTDTLSITGGQYTSATVGNDVVVTVGSDSILLTGAAKSNVEIIGERSPLYILTEGNDTYRNDATSATIVALGGNDTVENTGAQVSISGGAGYDTIINYGSNATIDGGKDDDEIELSENSWGNTIEYTDGDGDDVVIGFKEDDTLRIFSSYGNFVADTIENDILVKTDNGSVRLLEAAALSYVNIEGLDPDRIITLTENPDNYTNTLEGASIQALGGNDTVANSLSNVSIHGGADNDSIQNSGARVTISGGAGDDSIQNSETAYLVGGAGDDSIQNSGTRVTIDGDKGDDRISLGASAQNNLIIYNAGDGSDTVSGFKETDTLRIDYGRGEYSTQKSGNDIIVTTNDGSVTLLDAAGLSLIRIDGMLSKEERTITLTEGDDTYSNVIRNATIEALGGNDSIINDAADVSISGGADNDSVNSSGNWVTINAGAGDDSVRLDDNAHFTRIEYAAGDGNDTVIGFSTDDDLRISGGSYTRSTVGNDVVVSVGDGSVILSDATKLSDITIFGTRDTSGTGSDDTSDTASKLITLTEGDDTLRNTLDGATIAALGGNDSITNDANYVSISGGTGNDTIDNNDGTLITINGGTGDDSVRLDVNAHFTRIEYADGDGNDTVIGFSTDDDLRISGGSYTRSTVGNDVVISVGDGSVILSDAAKLSDIDIYGTSSKLITLTEGDDTLRNTVAGATIAALGGNDSITNMSASVSIDGGADKDWIFNFTGGRNSTIVGNAGDDRLFNMVARNVLIDGGADNDRIDNFVGDNSTIVGGDGNDTITNSSDNVTIDAGAGDDSITNWSDNNVTISAGTGNDRINLSEFATGNVIRYSLGDGDDTIWGFRKNSTIAADNIDWTSDNRPTLEDEDIVWGFSENSTLNIVADRSLISSVVSGDDVIIKVGDGSVTLKNARNRTTHIIIGEQGTEGGGSGNNNGGNNSSSGNNGDGGRGGNDTGNNTSGGTSSNEGRNSDASGGRSAVGSRGRSSSTSTDTGGNNVRVTTSSSSSRGGGSRIATGGSTVDLMSNWATSTQQTEQPTATVQRVYVGGNQVIGDYVSGEKIVFGEVYTGSFYDGAGNFFVGSSTGALVIQNAADKVVDLTDAAGNSFVKAYSATTAGVIDGRGLTGFEIINGSAGSDTIFAGDGGSQLWGGLDVAADTMVGGGGADIFIGGRTQGADVILNASATDIVHLNDANLSDIIATEENNGAIAVAFNTGNVVAVQSSEALSAAFMLADGSAYRYNHATRNWQSATN